MFKTLILCLSVVFCLASWVRADDHLLYFEAQGIGGYSSDLNKGIFYSQNPDAEMQHPSLGFDYVKRFSNESGDFLTFALQARLAIMVDPTKDETEVKLQPQIYNAYLKLKTPGPYVWVGHYRPAFGLSSYLDSHALLLRTLAIQGFGYDRDWGVGLYKDFSWGDIAATATTGSGMPVYFRGNYMAAARASYGVLSKDNYNFGVSLGYGNTMDTMGYTLFTHDPLLMRLVGVDGTLLMNNLEHRAEFEAGKWLNKQTYAGLYRFGINLDPENRLKLEAQPMLWKTGSERNFQMSFCFSFLATADLTLRLGYTYDYKTSDNLFALQLYYYRKI